MRVQNFNNFLLKKFISIGNFCGLQCLQPIYTIVKHFGISYHATRNGNVKFQKYHGNEQCQRSSDSKYKCENLTRKKYNVPGNFKNSTWST